MKVFTCDDHDFFWPVGVASVIVAKDRREAKKLLDQRLKEKGLKTFEGRKYTLVEMSMDKAEAKIISDGNY